MAPATRRALCIGICSYPNLPPSEQLKGCVNDARLAAQVLVDVFDFPAENVRLLLDEAASRDGILEALDRLVDETRPDDVVALHYSGHGSWTWDETGEEADGKDETIMPSDSGREEHPNRDIVDDELHAALVALTRKTPYVTFVFDSCHSGSITRAATGLRARSVRGAARGDPPAPPARDVARARLAGARGRAGPSGFMGGLGARYVLVAGCHDEERSFEYADEDGTVHGALSRHLYGYLSRGRPGTTYRDVFDHVSTAVTGRNDRQHPQLEGAADRVVFGVEMGSTRRYLLVTGRNGDTVAVGAGAAQGLRVGSTWVVLPPAGAGDEPVGRVEITAVSATASTGRLQPPGEGDDGAGHEAVGPACRLREDEHPWGDFRLPVHLARPEGATGDAWAALNAAVDASPLLRPTADAAEAELAVHRLEPGRPGPEGDDATTAPDAEGGPEPPQIPGLAEPAWVVVSRAGGLQVPPQAATDPAALVRNLERVARYRQALSLANPSRTSELAGKVRVDVLRAPAAPEEARTDPSSFAVAEPETAGGSVVLREGDRIGFRIHNRSDQDLYMNVLDFGLTGRVARIYPSNTRGELVAPGTFVLPGYLDLYIPDAFPFADDRYGPRRDEGPEVYKFVFTVRPADLSFLSQEGMEAGPPPATRGRGGGGSLLEFLGRSATQGTRDGSFVSTRVEEEDWVVVDKPLVLRRHQARALPEAGASLDLGGATLQADGVAGSVEAHGWDDRRVVAEQAAAPLDQALAAAGMDTARTFEIEGTAAPSGTRGTAPSLTFEVDAPEPGWGQVLLSADEAGVLRFHFGEPVPGPASRAAGPSSGRIRYRVPGTMAPAPDGPRTRGLAGALGRKFVKVLVFRAGQAAVEAAGRSLAEAWERRRVPDRLRAVTPEDLDRPDAPDLAADDAPAWARLGQGRALLLLHGTFSRTDRAFGGMPAEARTALHQRYEGRVFAFDHPTLSRTPTENVDRLLELLPADARLELDVVAHSRGGLVARRLASHPDPRVRVHRVVFAGSPNGGTAMASPAHINRLLDVYANLLTFFPDNGVTDAMEGLLAVVQDVVLGMAEGLRGLTAMVPGNDADQAVESGGGGARYFALASDYEPVELGLKTFMAPVVDQVFGGAGNDLVVPAESVWQGPGAPPFPLADEAVHVFGTADGVGHSDYFRSPVAFDRMMAWLA